MKPIDFVMLGLGALAVVGAALESRGIIPARVEPKMLLIVALLFGGA